MKKLVVVLAFMIIGATPAFALRQEPAPPPSIPKISVEQKTHKFPPGPTDCWPDLPPR
jgi:hypothetical protein